MKVIYEVKINDQVWQVTPGEEVDLGEWGVLTDATLLKDEEYCDFYLVGTLQDCPDEKVNGVTVFFIDFNGDPDLYAYGEEAVAWANENLKEEVRNEIAEIKKVFKR